MTIRDNALEKEVPAIHKFIDYPIPNGQNQGDVVDLSGATLTAIKVPAAITGATFAFDAGEAGDHGDMAPMTDDVGVAVAATITSPGYVVVSPSIFHSVRFLRIRTDLVQAGGDVTLILVVRPV